MRRPALALAATPPLALAACGGAEAGAEEHASPVRTGSSSSTAPSTTRWRAGADRRRRLDGLLHRGGRRALVRGPRQHEKFREPASGETHHIEIIPTETSTGRIVPDVLVNVQVIDEKGAVVDEQS